MNNLVATIREYEIKIWTRLGHGCLGCTRMALEVLNGDVRGVHLGFICAKLRAGTVGLFLTTPF